MHPFIRILSLLVIAAFLPWMPAIALWMAVAVFLCWGVAQPATGRAMVRNLKRIRWLMLSLFILYLWFSPGAPILPALGALSPTDTGVVLALHRAAVLLVMASAAVAFLHDATPRELAAGLRQLLTWPVHTDVAARFADRMGLLFGELADVERRLRERLEHGEGRFVDRAAELFRGIETEAAQPVIASAPQVSLPVPRTQYLLPAALLTAGVVLAFFLPGY